MQNSTLINKFFQQFKLSDKNICTGLEFYNMLFFLLLCKWSNRSIVFGIGTKFRIIVPICSLSSNCLAYSLPSKILCPCLWPKLQYSARKLKKKEKLLIEMQFFNLYYLLSVKINFSKLFVVFIFTFTFQIIFVHST